MDANVDIKAEQVTTRLWQIAFGILVLAIIPLGVGLRFRASTYIRIGTVLLIISFVLMMVATIIWAVGWIKKNVHVD